MDNPRHIALLAILGACACSSDVPLPPQPSATYDNSTAEIAGTSVDAKPKRATSLSSAVFCKKERWKESIFAARFLSDGSLEFGISEWEKERGHNFSVVGIAYPVEQTWLYQEGRGEDACQIKIVWANPRTVSIDVDPVASCRADAGANFGEKSEHFERSHYKKAVTDELGEDGAFVNADPCKDSAVRT